jgi:hypothetical protein
MTPTKFLFESEALRVQEPGASLGWFLQTQKCQTPIDSNLEESPHLSSC